MNGRKLQENQQKLKKKAANGKSLLRENLESIQATILSLDLGLPQMARKIFQSRIEAKTNSSCRENRLLAFDTNLLKILIIKTNLLAALPVLSYEKQSSSRGDEAQGCVSLLRLGCPKGEVKRCSGRMQTLQCVANGSEKRSL